MKMRWLLALLVIVVAVGVGLGLARVQQTRGADVRDRARGKR